MSRLQNFFAQANQLRAREGLAAQQGAIARRAEQQRFDLRSKEREQKFGFIQDLLGGFGGGEGGEGSGGFLGGGSDAIANVRESGIERITGEFDEATQSALADLASRGLASSSLAATTRQGGTRQQQRAISEFEGSLLGPQIQQQQGNRQLIAQLLGGLF